MIARLGVTVKIAGLMPGTEWQQDRGNLDRCRDRRIRQKVAIRAPVVMPGMVAADIVHGHAQHRNLIFCRIRPVRCHHGSGQGAANRENDHGRPEHEKLAKRVGHKGEVYQPHELTPASLRRCVIVGRDHGWGQPVVGLPRIPGPAELIWNFELRPKRTFERIAENVRSPPFGLHFETGMYIMSPSAKLSPKGGYWGELNPALLAKSLAFRINFSRSGARGRHNLLFLLQ